MAGYGEVYAEVEAGVVNSGINTLAGSGEIGEEGDAGTIVVWLLWSYDDTIAGFTGKDWYWGDELNPLSSAWSNNLPTGYSNDVNGFNQWLRDTNPSELDMYLGKWDSQAKADFCTRYNNVLGVGVGGCIEYRGY